MRALTLKYRPQKFEDVIGQNITTTILEKTIAAGQLKNCILLCGKSGCGKTTTARIIANMLNNGVGNPIEIDAASNGGVDNIRSIIDSANQRSLTSVYKVFIIDECVSGDTEILTEDGWKRFDQLNKTERVAQYNDDGTIEFVTPTEFIEKDYTGDMYRVSIGNKAEFIMSPNHVQPLYYEKSGKIKENYIKDIKFAQTNRFIRSGRGAGTTTSLTAMDRLAIALQADGCLQHTTATYNYWTIQLKRTNKITNLLQILAEAGVEYKEIKSIRDEVRRFEVYTPLTITKKLSSYFMLDNMSYSYARDFIAEILKWDGFSKDKYLYYSCIDKANVDFCQAVGILGGFKSRIGVQIDNRKESYKPSYRLYIEDSITGTTNGRVSKEAFAFSGKIYCVKVPSHKIIIRRDGFELVTGNCHAISSAGWQAFLKGIEEPAEYTYYIFCTTEPNKIPNTILNRVQRYNIAPISIENIKARLEYICNGEGFTNYSETCDYIAKMSNGEMRAAIMYLEQCADYSTDLTINNAKMVLGDISYEIMLKLTNALIDGNKQAVLNFVDQSFANGIDLKQFISSYLDFVIDLNKYLIFGNIACTNIPEYLETTTDQSINIKYTTGIENCGEWFSRLIDKIFEMKMALKNDPNYISTIKVYLLRICRGI